MNLPKENIGAATGKARKDSTPQNGDFGALDNLNESIENNKNIEFIE